MFDEFVELLPEDKREAFKAVASKAVVIGSREDAAKVFADNQFVKSEFQANLSRLNEQYAAKFKEEKLPSLLDEEYRKKYPAKDPKDQALESMQKELAEMKRQTVIEKRNAEAVAKLSELGLPTYLSKFVINEDENIFANNINELSGLINWKAETVKKELEARHGNMPVPKAGTVGSVDFSKMSVTEVMQYAGQSPEAMKAVMDYQQRKK